MFLLTEAWNRNKQSLQDPTLHILADNTLPSLLIAARASSTTQKYLTTWGRWENWARTRIGVEAFPADPYHLALYIAHLSTTSGAKTAADAVSACVKWVHSLAGLPSPTDDCMFRLALQGYNRTHTTPITRKEPITPEILEKLLVSHGHSTATLLDLRTLFVCFISYAGFFEIRRSKPHQTL